MFLFLLAPSSPPEFICPNKTNNWIELAAGGPTFFFLRGVPPLFFRHSSKPSRSQVQILWTDKSSRDSIRTLVQRRGVQGKVRDFSISWQRDTLSLPRLLHFVCFLVMKQAGNAIEQIDKIFDQEEGEHAGQRDNREQQNEHPIVHSSNKQSFFLFFLSLPNIYKTHAEYIFRLPHPRLLLHLFNCSRLLNVTSLASYSSWQTWMKCVCTTPLPLLLLHINHLFRDKKKKNRTKETKIWENKVPSLVTQTWDNLSDTFPFLLPFSSFSFVVVVNPFSLQAPSYLSLSSLYIMNSINKNVDLGTLRIENTNQVLLKIDQSLWCFPGKKWPVKTAIPEQPWAMQVQSRCLFLFYFVFCFFLLALCFFVFRPLLLCGEW